MSKFQAGDEVVIKRLTTPGCVEFEEWAKRHLKNQTPIVVKYGGEPLLFEGADWCLFTRDVEKYQPIMENE